MIGLFWVAGALAATPAEVCSGVLDRVAAEQAAAMERFGAPADPGRAAALRAAFPARMATACAAMDPLKLDCVAAAPSALVGIGACGLNTGKGNGERLDLPWIGAPFLPTPAPSGTPAALEAAKKPLLGTWTDNQGAYARTWVFRADGTATETAANNGSPAQKEYTWEVINPSTIRLTQGGSSANRFFDIAGGWLALGTGPDAVLPDATKDRALLVLGGNPVVVEGLASGHPTCWLADSYGVPAERCSVTVGKAGADTQLQIEAKFGYTLATGAPISNAMTYTVVLHGGRPFLAGAAGHWTKLP